MGVAETPDPTARGVVAIIWRQRFLRGSSVALFLAGLAVSSTMPQMTLFLINELRMPIGLVGLYYLVNLMAPVMGFVVGSVSERVPDRLVVYRVCSVIGALGWLAMAQANQMWIPFVIGGTALCVGGVALGQLFAAIRDELTLRPSPANTQVIAALRILFSAGWIIGPVLGSWFGAVAGLRAMLIAAAVCAVAQIVPLGTTAVRRVVTRRSPRTPNYLRGAPFDSTAANHCDRADQTAVPIGRDRARLNRAGDHRSMVPLLVFLACCVLVQSGNAMKFAYLPIYMDINLGLSDTVRGVVISVQPLLELISIPLFAWLATRIPPIWVMTIAATFAVSAYVTHAGADTVFGLIAGQIFMSGALGAFAGLGITVAQQLYADRVGLASSLFSGALPLTNAVGGSVGAFGLAYLGLPALFYLPAGLALVGLVGFIGVAMRYKPDDDNFAPAPPPASAR